VPKKFDGHVKRPGFGYQVKGEAANASLRRCQTRAKIRLNRRDKHELPKDDLCDGEFSASLWPPVARPVPIRVNQEE